MRIDILAQSETAEHKSKKFETRIVYGKNSHITNGKAIRFRASCKLIAHNDNHVSTLTVFVADAGLDALLEYHIDMTIE